MATYVALLRGIMPQNPNMKSEKLRGAFETAGFKNVQTVIGSGNVVFESASKSEAALEKKIEDMLERELGFKRAAIVRSMAELLALAKKDPFKALSHGKSSYLIVTFFKQPAHVKRPFPRGGGFTRLYMDERSLCSVIDMSVKTPDVMQVLEKEFGRDITTRTWATVGKILAKMQA